MSKSVISIAIASLKKEPNLKSETTDEVFHGTVVEELSDIDNGFYLIKTPYNYEGYVHESCINRCKDICEIWSSTYTHVISGFTADVLSEPRVQGYLIITLVKGSFVIVTGKNVDGWSKVVTASGEEGFIRTNFLSDIKNFTSQSESQFRDNVINIAKQYTATQYRWGGKSPLGIDCSGLVFISYFLNGISVYRDAQIKDGFPVKEIPFSRIKKGDLIFFPKHVALYLGDEKFIHSSFSNHGVYENSLNPKDNNYSEKLANSITYCGSIF